jgi:hypothetical protein
VNHHPQAPPAPPLPSLATRYHAAITHCVDAACARRRFPDYDAHRSSLMVEVRDWLFGGNPHGAANLTELARKMDRVVPPCISPVDGHQCSNAGLVEYLCLLCDEVRREQQAADGSGGASPGGTGEDRKQTSRPADQATL